MRSRAGMGYGVEIGPIGTKENDTYTCAHGPCNRIVHVKPFERPEDKGGMCKTCGGLICRECLGKPCVPIEKWLEQVENPHRQIGRIHGFWKRHVVRAR